MVEWGLLGSAATHSFYSLDFMFTNHERNGIHKNRNANFWPNCQVVKYPSLEKERVHCVLACYMYCSDERYLATKWQASSVLRMTQWLSPLWSTVSMCQASVGCLYMGPGQTLRWFANNRWYSLDNHYAILRKFTTVTKRCKVRR